ncbi:DEAD/DEAH box helicase-like protein [Phaeosphaeria sp. MPI-PUGE-AT-0046c]|nr:DEAD/DEAH box helicase-like protein [Phaeosphaeria sp. MPI-PUGE-AT-0046c]
MGRKSKEDDVSHYYQTVFSRRVDLVGDYAGSEIFLVEFDSLLLRCFSDPKLDFGNGFQLLHAVYIVEKFLQDLLSRRCQFQVVCFDQNEDLCVPSNADRTNWPKYALARSVIFRHLARNLRSDNRVVLKRFNSFMDDDFWQYLNQSGTYFVMCHDGAMPDATESSPTLRSDSKQDLQAYEKDQMNLRAMILWFMGNRYDVALINELHCADSKVTTVILESSRQQRRKDFAPFHRAAASHNVFEIESLTMNNLRGIHELSERDVITVLVLRAAMLRGAISSEEASAFLLHTAALHYFPLANRRPTITTKNTSQRLVSLFTQSAASLLRNETLFEQLNALNLPANLADLLDGFLLAALTRDTCLRNTLLANTLESGDIFNGTLPNCITAGCQVSHESTQYRYSAPSKDKTILPFQNAVFDKHLAPVRLHLEESTSDGTTPDNVKVFQELSHWHNHRKALISKAPKQQLGYHARRRNDLYMAEMHAYAASLTNAAGKVLEPETIVINKRPQPCESERATVPEIFHCSHQLHKGAYPKSSKKSNMPTKKSGKSMALEAAAAIKAAKTQSKGGIDAAYWKAKCNELRSQPNLQHRYLAARDYSTKLHSANLFKPEVELYTVDCLLRIWLECRRSAGVDTAGSLAALIWYTLLEMMKTRSGMTPEVVASLNVILNVLELPALKFEAQSASRPLEFTCIFNEATAPSNSVYAFINSSRLPVPGGSKVFQLEHCGPYLEREINSAVDERVPFRPDAWQRQVLDVIDEHQSLFVIAPTSAGKTFISFYAMKQVLMMDDDGVVVYVAPTKALVNQIAAEIQARFSKSFKHPGKSVWAIHTRDYRINNATGCQILVTVPHILQIMLLAPSNAKKAGSWSCRIKRIIFDEVHCIGQAEDGVVWEQLLLQSPCPIIALSATVGNPEEFSTWLGRHKKQTDLRKFVYVPPKKFCFSELPDTSPIQGLGLDGTEAFEFVHPISSLNNKSRGIPRDLHLEARDCLRLWQMFEKYSTKGYVVPNDLSPNQALPDVIKKIHIFKWERKLKATLLEWMNDGESPEKVQQDLSKTLVNPANRDILSTKHTCDDGCVARNDNKESLSSLILPALTDLHVKNALPAIVFNYDRGQCEKLMRDMIQELEMKELAWKDSNTSWMKRLAAFDRFKEAHEAIKTSFKDGKGTGKRKAKREGGNKREEGDEERVSKLDREREAGSVEHSKWDGFDPHAPINGFHFANTQKLLRSELDIYKQQLRDRGVAGWLISALSRGVGVHHAGMNRKYRQVVEILFRRGYLQVVIATGTLALGINMPCKTVVFAGDSVFLTALNFRYSRLPDLKGHFPITTSLVLRLATLLHGSNGSDFAIRTINSVLSQPRLYLGSPKSKMAVLHHLRFSIEYLRRQSLLDVNGSPINFAGCVSHLYYTENSAWAFHVLLSSGYFHNLCQDIDTSPHRVCLTLMLVLSHIFGRQQCKRADKEFIEEVVKRSSSVVFLPPMPKRAEDTLRAHNKETLAIFRTYVRTFADQHLKDPDDALPLSEMRIGREEEQFSITPSAKCRHTVLRSPFVSLSGHGDEFDSISDLCGTVRSGVFLEEAVVPYLPIHPESTVPLNAYLYDFYKHGDLLALERANKIRRSDVWFHLNDFSLVLATIITALTNFMKPCSASEADATDLKGSGDAHAESEDESMTIESDDNEKQRSNNQSSSDAWGPLGAWDDEEDDELEDENDADMRLPKVLQAFKCLKRDFDSKFKQMWA